MRKQRRDAVNMISNFAVVMNDLFMSAALIVLDCHRHNHQYSDSELINKRWYTAKKNPVTELVIWWLTNLWPVRKSVKGSVILLAGTVYLAEKEAWPTLWPELSTYDIPTTSRLDDHPTTGCVWHALWPPPQQRKHRLTGGMTRSSQIFPIFLFCNYSHTV